MKLPPLPDQISSLLTTFEFKIPGGLVFAPSYLQALVMVFLIFLLILTLGQFRRHLVDWHFKGLVPGVFFGFLLTLFLEGFFVVGGKTILTEVLGWRDAPKPLVNVLDVARGKAVAVLGVTQEIPTSEAANIPVDKILENISSLTPEEIDDIRVSICTPIQE